MTGQVCRSVDGENQTDGLVLPNGLFLPGQRVGSVWGPSAMPQHAAGMLFLYGIILPDRNPSSSAVQPVTSGPECALQDCEAVL